MDEQDALRPTSRRSGFCYQGHTDFSVTWDYCTTKLSICTYKNSSPQEKSTSARVVSQVGVQFAASVGGRLMELTSGVEPPTSSLPIHFCIFCMVLYVFVMLGFIWVFVNIISCHIIGFRRIKHQINTKNWIGVYSENSWRLIILPPRIKGIYGSILLLSPKVTQRYFCHSSDRYNKSLAVCWQLQ